MSDHDVVLMDRENDRLADEELAIENAHTALYFDAFDELARDGALFDPQQDNALIEAVWSGEPDGIDFREVARLVGAVHRVSTLDKAGRDRADTAIGRYVREMFERHVLAVTYDAAVAEVTR